MTLPVTVAWRMPGAAVPPAGLWNFSFPTTFSLSCRPGCLLTFGSAASGDCGGPTGDKSPKNKEMTPQLSSWVSL